MNPRERLEQYLDALRGRIRTLIYARAAGAGALGVVVLTAAWVWMLNRDGFPAPLAMTGRVLIIAMLAAVAFALVWLPLRKLSRKEGAAEIERRLPAQHGRIETYLDMRRRQAEGVDSALVDLLADDAATLAEATPVREVIPSPRIWTGGGIAAAAAALLLLLMVAGPAYWGYGSRHFLLGMSLPRDAVPLRRVAVTPGDATVRRNSDLAIRASIEGFRPDEASVFVRYDGEQAWQRAPMQPVRDSERARWEFKLYALRGPLHYYVQAENSRSSEKSVQHSIAVVDLPHIERVRLTYDYPDWTDLPPRVEETVRDIHAVPGTGVKLEVFANAALDSPVVVVDGEQVSMESEAGAATGSIRVRKAGTYRISARVADELVPLTDEYTIELVADEKPTVAIEKPGRDWHATSIEEVPVRISANDDFRLQNVELRYAVNGGEWKKMDVTRGGKEVRQDSLLKLEEMRAAPGARLPATEASDAQPLEPGDLVSYYAVARDRNQSVQTDLFMVQVQPFERRFMQGANGGGGGSGNPADEQGAISERQREILLATWNLQRSDNKASRSRKQLEENARMLAEMQALLAQQARTLSERTRARVSLDEDARVKQFVESLERAAEVMDPAARHLEDFKLAQAIPAEQQALQQLLRAEAAFREVQVSMQRDSAGGGAQAARSLTEMLELEMDVDKNHYETESQLAKTQKKEELNDALRKLKELAARQEKLAQEMQRKAVPEREQRWRQEQLRREAEDLRRRLAELQRQQQNSPNSQSPNSQSSDSQSGSSQGQQQSGERQEQQSGNERMANAMDTMRRALDDMRAASSEQQGSSGSSGESAQEASRKLKKALDQMDQPPPQGLSETLEQFASRTEKLANRQRETEADLYDAISDAERAGRRRGQLDPQRAEKLTRSKQEMAEEVRRLQQEMRDAMNDHRVGQPASTRQLGEIVSELESTNVVTRISRSAAEIQYGRARDAASREGLITDVLDSLEKALHENAQLAAREGKRDAAPADPEAVLAELSELRRALQEAQRGKGQAGNQSGQGQTSDRERQQARQQGQGPGQQQSQQQGQGKGQGQESRQEGQGQGQEQGSQQGQRQASSGQSGNPSSGGAANNGGLGAWNPGSFAPQGNMRAARSGWIGNLEPTDAAQFRRDAAEVAESVRDLADRMRSADLSPAEVNALRRMAHELRSLAGDPMASQAQAMAKLVDQIELATLAAATKVRSATPAHTTSATAEEPQYREAVAEYYRRLGGS